MQAAPTVTDSQRAVETRAGSISGRCSRGTAKVPSDRAAASSTTMPTIACTPKSAGLSRRASTEAVTMLVAMATSRAASSQDTLRRIPPPTRAP